MNETQPGSNSIKILRFIAVIGTLLAALYKIFSVSVINPNQIYSFYALMMVLVGSLVILFVWRKTTLRVLKNPDLLVPVGLYVTAKLLCEIGAASSTFIGFRDGAFNWQGLSFMLIVFWGVQVILAVCLTGWMTRIILRLVEHEKVDIVAAFHDFGRWFPRTLVFMLFGWIPLYLLLAYIFLPFGAGGSGGAAMWFLYPFILFIGIFALFWNLATAVLLPFVLKAETPLRESFIEGIKFSWAHKAKTFVPILLLMIVAGWIILLSVTYTEQEQEEGEFGTAASYYSERVSSTSNFATNYIWIGSYQTGSEWHKTLLKMVKQEPLSSVSFRIMLLMLLISLVTNLKIIDSVFKTEPATGEIKFELSSSDRRLYGGAAALVCLVIFLLPLEYLRIFAGWNFAPIREFKTQKIYRGGGFFEKRELLTFDRSSVVENDPKASDDYSIGRIIDITFESAKQSFIISGSSSAVVLDTNGNVREEITFDLSGIGGSDHQKPYFSEIKAVDLDDDGNYEFAGYGGYPYTAIVLDSKGAMRRSYPGAGIDINKVEAHDIDDDRKKEILVADKEELKIFDLNGNKKGVEKISSGFGNDIYFVDADGDGQTEIVNDRISSRYVIEFNGGDRAKIEKPVEIRGILEETGENPLILFMAENKLGLFGFDGSLVGKYDAPLSDIDDTRFFREENELGYYQKYVDVYKARAIKVKLKANEPKYLAVLATMATKSGDYFVNMLYVYDPNGQLVYQESLRDGNEQIRSCPNEDGTENLVILEEKTIWVYKAN